MTVRLRVGVLMALHSTITPRWAAPLARPAPGATLAGLGCISGWQCDAGAITVSIHEGGHLLVASGPPRAAIRPICGPVHHGFLPQLTWALLGAGPQDLGASDEGGAVARPTVQSGTRGVDASEACVPGATGEGDGLACPGPGEQARLEGKDSPPPFARAEIRKDLPPRGVPPLPPEPDEPGGAATPPELLRPLIGPGEGPCPNLPEGQTGTFTAGVEDAPA